MTDPACVPAGTTDPVLELQEAIRALIPEAFPDGVLDPVRLLSSIGDPEPTAEGFSFTWPGIGTARDQARQPTTSTLQPDEAASVNFAGARDVLIEGDNLQVLKVLRAGYQAAAKLIYIDPPYNTGSTFTYNDAYSIPEPEYLRRSGQVDEHGQLTTSKLETRGKKHAPWLTMMFPRLAVARHLLRRDGVFIASIDNNEVHHLRILLDAVFGASNFVDMFTWRGARKGDARLTGGGQDYMLVYARDLAHLKETDTRWRERKQGLEAIYARVAELRVKHDSDYTAMTKELRAWYRSLSDADPSKEHDQYNRVDERGIWYPDNISSPNFRKNLVYNWKGYSPPQNGWRYDEAGMEALDADARLIYPEDKAKRVQLKAYLHMRETWAPPSVFYKDRRAASASLDALMGAKVFDDPKSTDVLARLVDSLTGTDDLVIDLFAGSGSTAQAVWEQNARDGADRRWLLVQQPELPDTTTESGENAINAGFATIFDITAERLRRAARPDAGLGFRVFRASDTNLAVDGAVVATEGMSGADYVQATLAAATQPTVARSAKALNVAWEVALKATRIQLDARVSERDVGGVAVFEFSQDDSADRLFVSLGPFTVATAEQLGLGPTDTLILQGDAIDDATTLTLAPRLQKNLILIERVVREVSL